LTDALPEQLLDPAVPPASATAQHHSIWQQTKTYIRSIARTHGPFDGIAGFSEGAAAAYHLLCLQRQGEDVGLAEVGFFLGFSPWISPLHADPAPLSIPFLATAGRNDHDMFLSQLPTFRIAFGDRMLLHEHDGKHVYPFVNAPLRAQLDRLCSELGASKQQ